ncbi:Crp/Fnr family transcriptional regulator [Chryseobacterium indoltheticum]|uniref:Crp/Fnr family transcriptional regulator n=1 Tax=Chryseobacterium indoltheticum TaxID=254 RepID=UPI001912F15B|nr:Crp/Fnr family transcriptional regulator [Chryseobacterium indoltheticum]QQQ29124.1 Crp/Fnr family transcriptional regulator [Chryseobacterium indoltheticum]
MFLKEELLHSIGAVEHNYKPGDYIFHEGGNPQFYFQVVIGNIKLNNYNSAGKEFIQSILSSKDSVGEYMLYTEKTYPVNAVAVTNCTILRICSNRLQSYLNQNPGLYLDLCRSLSNHLYRKFVLMQKMTSHSAVERLREVLELMKQEQGISTPFTFEVPMTRQQLASLTGLCVETTIRAVKKMERDKIVRIANRKILY